LFRDHFDVCYSAVDSHNHLLSTFSALKKQDPTKDYSIADFDHYALEQGLNRFASFGSSINVNCDPASFQSGLQIQRTIPNFYGAFGIHPHNAVEYNDQVEVEIAAALQDPKSVAVGEMGLDYYYMNSTREIQIACFRRQLKWGIEVMKKPIIIHTRDAEDDTKAILEEIVPVDWKVHIHCFTGSPEFAKWATARFPNLFIGFTGCITFPSASNLRDLIQELPLERLLLVHFYFILLLFFVFQVSTWAKN
jgi:TatD DNase family protein